MSRSGINKVILIGNVGAEPEVRYTANGSVIANLTLATSESWKDRNTGEMQEATEWHRISIFGKIAEIVQQYVHKGSKLYIEGKLKTRKWQDQKGQDRYTTEVIVDFSGQFQILSNSANNGMPGKQNTQQLSNNSTMETQPQQNSQANYQQAQRSPAPPLQQQSNFQHNQTASTPQQTAQRSSPSIQNVNHAKFEDDIPF